VEFDSVVPYCGDENAESVTNEDADGPDDLFDEPGSTESDEDDDCSPHFGANETDEV